MVTRGQRSLGRTIRKLSNSIEFSNKESIAKETEKKYKENIRKRLGYAEDYPVQSLRYPPIQPKDSK